jgi:hypothetical protein
MLIVEPCFIVLISVGVILDCFVELRLLALFTVNQAEGPICTEVAVSVFLLATTSPIGNSTEEALRIYEMVGLVFFLPLFLPGTSPLFPWGSGSFRNQNMSHLY